MSNKAPKGLTYSTTAPQTPGRYWMKRGRRTLLVDVFFSPGHGILSIEDPSTKDHMRRSFLAVDSLNALWSGPLEEA